MTRWARAGVRADPKEARARAGKLNQTKAARAAALEEARTKWARGLVRPYLITQALNLRGLEGPDVDVACLAAEPDVDNWEAGILYPSFEQLVALAELTGVQPRFFTSSVREPPMAWWETSMRFHVRREPDLLEAAGPVMAFTPEAVRAAGLVYP